MRVDASTERPAELLLDGRELVAFRVRGRPRDPEDGTHRQVVVFVAPDLAPTRLAGLLRGAADALAPREAPL